MAMEYVDPQTEWNDMFLDNEVRYFTRKVVGVDTARPSANLHNDLVVPMNKKSLMITLANERVLGGLTLLKDTLDYTGADLPAEEETTVNLFAAIDWDDDPHLYTAASGIRVVSRLHYELGRPDDCITESIKLQTTREKIRPSLSFMAVKQTIGDQGQPTVLRPQTTCPENFGAPARVFLEFLEAMYALSTSQRG